MAYYDLKTKGNQCYKEGDYSGAEELYSQAILKNPREPTLFGNRALVRIKLESWAGAEHDARLAADLHGLKNPATIKMNYYLAQALLGLQKPTEAYEVALPAYRHSLEIRNPNSEVLSKTILRAKQAIWAAKETARLRELNGTLKRVEEMLESELESELRQLEERLQAGEIGQIGYVEDQKEFKEETAKRIQDVRDAFGTALSGDMKERHVPDYLIDGISFEVMHDPVVTPSGHSFDRTGILRHVDQSGVDPITRVPMTANDLRPNYALKAACDDFLEKNGWAVDY
ncbi:hypothetical protein FQN54_002945 [Arachnomyces sp. PD_36]|nr:hypothetical protein FQN54_002945 [Arachnomyces sp. PD_36]